MDSSNEPLFQGHSGTERRLMKEDTDRAYEVEGNDALPLQASGAGALRDEYAEVASPDHEPFTLTLDEDHDGGGGGAVSTGVSPTVPYPTALPSGFSSIGLADVSGVGGGTGGGGMAAAGGVLLAGQRGSNRHSSHRGTRIRPSELNNDDERLWLVRHEIGQNAVLKSFRTVTQFAQHAHSLLHEEAAATSVVPTVEALAQHNKLVAPLPSMLIESTMTEHNPQLLAGMATAAAAEVPCPALPPSPPQPQRQRLNVRRGRLARSASSSSSSSSSSCVSNVSNAGDSRDKRRQRRGARRSRRKRSLTTATTTDTATAAHRSTHSKTRTSKSSPRSSSGSSSSDSDEEVPLRRSFWLDLQTSDPVVMRRVMELFPLHDLTVEEVLHPETSDVLEAFTALNYVFVNLRCTRLKPEEYVRPTAHSPAAAAGRPTPTSLVPPEERAGAALSSAQIHGSSESEDESHVIVSVIVFEDWFVTIHRHAFSGLHELVVRMKSVFGLGKSSNTTTTAATSVGHPVGGGGGDASAVPGATALATGLSGVTLRELHTPLMSSSWIFATLVDFVTETFLPDPTKTLAEVDAVDEMVLLIGAEENRQDQTDLLLRIAVLRRKISTQRAALFQKEQFVLQLLMPAMRTTFVAKQSSISELYKHTLTEVGHVAERLDVSRDVLNQANHNFINSITLNMSHSSARTSLKMQLLTQVSTIVLPLNLVAGIFGMNIQIPWQNTEPQYQNYHAFAVIVGLMGLWFLLFTPQLYRTFRAMQREKHKARSREDALKELQ